MTTWNALSLVGNLRTLMRLSWYYTLKVVKLKSSITDQQVAENRQAALEVELRRFVEQAETHAMEISHMQKLLEASGKERDHVLSEVYLSFVVIIVYPISFWLA